MSEQPKPLSAEEVVRDAFTNGVPGSADKAGWVALRAAVFKVLATLEAERARADAAQSALEDWQECAGNLALALKNHFHEESRTDEMREALAEFEEARKLARPDLLVDPEEWRLNVISRTEELNRLLDPKPRVTRDGVQFRANKLLIRREKQRVPAVADGAQDSNVYGEQSRRSEMRAARAHAEGLDGPGGISPGRARGAKPAAAVAPPPDAMPSLEEQERAARSLSFQDGDIKQAEVLNPGGEAPAAKANPAAKDARAALKPAAPSPKAILPNDEETVTTKRVEGLAPAGKPAADAGAAKSAQPSQQDVERVIEEAVQKKIQAERNGAAQVEPSNGGE